MLLPIFENEVRELLLIQEELLMDDILKINQDVQYDNIDSNTGIFAKIVLSNAF